MIYKYNYHHHVMIVAVEGMRTFLQEARHKLVRSPLPRWLRTFLAAGIKMKRTLLGPGSVPPRAPGFLVTESVPKLWLCDGGGRPEHSCVDCRGGLVESHAFLFVVSQTPRAISFSNARKEGRATRRAD